jgi:hypothetical protein
MSEPGPAPLRQASADQMPGETPGRPLNGLRSRSSLHEQAGVVQWQNDSFPESEDALDQAPTMPIALISSVVAPYLPLLTATG